MRRPECEVVEERVEVDVAGREKVDAREKNDDEDCRGDHPLADPEPGLTKSEDAVAALTPGALRERRDAAPQMPEKVANRMRCLVLLDVVQGRGHVVSRLSLNRMRALD